MALQRMASTMQAIKQCLNLEKENTQPTASDAPTRNTVSLPESFHDLIPGYPKLAGRMGVMPEIAMFRRFGALNARNLLYLQNDLVMLEQELRLVEAEDAKSSEGKKERYGRNAYWLSNSDQHINGRLRDGDTRQRDLVIKMRSLLKDYNHALIQQVTILRDMKKPDPFDIHDIQNFIASDYMEQPFCGAERKMWGSATDDESRKAYSRELIVLRPRKDMDTLSRVLGTKAIDWIMKLGGKRWKKIDVRFGTRAIHDETIFRFTFWLTSGIASILPVVSIILLVKMDSLNGRLGLIALFNVLTSICLTFCTEARRTDVFAVTAAFAAVQVVFVGQAIEKDPGGAIKAALQATNCTC